jgi:hypothetical protein
MAGAIRRKAHEDAVAMRNDVALDSYGNRTSFKALPHSIRHRIFMGLSVGFVARPVPS